MRRSDRAPKFDKLVCKQSGSNRLACMRILQTGHNMLSQAAKHLRWHTGMYVLAHVRVDARGAVICLVLREQR